MQLTDWLLTYKPMLHATAIERKSVYLTKSCFFTSSKGKENSTTKKTIVKTFHGNLPKIDLKKHKVRTPFDI